MMSDACSNAGSMAVSLKSQDGYSHPECFTTCCGSVVRERVKGDVNAMIHGKVLSARSAGLMKEYALF